MFLIMVEALSAGTVPKNGNAIDVERPAADVPSLESGPAHSCADPFDDQIPFQFGDGPDDDDHGPAERAAGIQVLPEADELDAEMVELIGPQRRVFDLRSIEQCSHHWLRLGG
jgi:hypothetical protein